MEVATTINPEGNGMLLKTILNRIQRYPGFVFVAFRLLDHPGELRLEIDIEPRKGSRAICSGCEQHRPGYDRLRPRRFEFVPVWAIPVAFVYAMRRVDCPSCSIRVEVVPWAEGKNHLTKSYAWFLAGWAKRMSWSDVAAAFRTTWENVFRSLEMAVQWGLQHRSLDGIESLGIDELYWSRRHQYLTLVYQIDAGARRLLWIGKKRTLKTLLGFFRWFGPKRSQALRFICSDMWKPYLRVVAKKAAQAIHVLDRFHIASHLSKAIDEVRAKEAKELRSRGLQPFLGIFLFAVGEMVASPRIQEYITWIARKEKAGLYMGSNFLAVGIGGFTSGITYTTLYGRVMDLGHPEYVWYALAARFVAAIVVLNLFVKLFGEFREQEA